MKPTFFTTTIVLFVIFIMTGSTWASDATLTFDTMIEFSDISTEKSNDATGINKNESNELYGSHGEEYDRQLIEIYRQLNNLINTYSDNLFLQIIVTGYINGLKLENPALFNSNGEDLTEEPEEIPHTGIVVRIKTQPKTAECD